MKNEVFEEAVATVLSCAPTEPFIQLRGKALTIPLSLPRHDSYEVWSAVFTELLRRGSLEELKRLEALFDLEGADFGAFDAALLEVYGLSLDELWEQMKWAGQSTCLPIGRCDQPKVELGINTVIDACDGLHERVLDDSLAPALGISTGESEAYFIACDLHAPYWRFQREHLRSLGSEFIVQPPRSLHLLTRPPTMSEETSISVRRVEGAFGPSCESVKGEVLEMGSLNGQEIILSNEEGDYWFHVARAEAPLRVSVQAPRGSGSGSGFRAWACESCPADLETECVELTYERTIESSFFLLLSVEPGQVEGPTAYLRLDIP